MIVIVMGVAGSGKSTVGSLLASELGWPFVDADQLHPPASVAKMAGGTPLDDADRLPWLQAIRARIARCLAERQSAVFACSALKQSYRDMLRAGAGAVCFVYLRGHYGLFAERMSVRPNHFMKSELLASQFETLEEPADALAVDAARTPAEVVAEIRSTLGV